MGDGGMLANLVTTAPSIRVMGMHRDGAVISHADFIKRTTAWFHFFRKQAGQNWALYHEDAFECAAALYGAWHAGKVIYLPGDTQPGTLAALGSLVDGMAGNIPGHAGELPEACAESADFQPLDPQQTRLFVFTSGSTGTPKSIEKTLAHLICEVETLERFWGSMLGDACVYATVSHQHFYGLIYGLLWPLSAGRVFFSHRLLYSENIAATLQNGPAVLISSPAHLKRLPQGGAEPRMYVRGVFSAGGELPLYAADIVRRYLGRSPIEIFGSSEMGSIFWRNLEKEFPTWTAIPGVSWKIEGDVLHVRSPFLANDDWRITEDRAAERDGHVELLGRADRIVKIEEQRVSLIDIERHLCKHDLVAEARVVVVNRARDVLAAVVVPTEAGFSILRNGGRGALSQKLKAYLAEVQTAVVFPRLWRFVDVMPHNTQGKTSDALLRTLFQPERPVAHWSVRRKDHAELHLEVAEDLVVFDGHFPSVSILPGVAQLDWAVHFSRHAFAVLPPFCGIQMLKFQKVIMPGTRLTLSLRHVRDARYVEFTYTSAQGTHASGRLLFRQIDA